MRFTENPIEPFGEIILDMAVPSQLSLKGPVVFRMVKALSDRGCIPWTGSHRAELCIEEAVTNAMVHGNKLDPSKKVRIILFADDERWGAIIEDQGDGFGPEDVPSPDDPDFIFREAGRGILLMESYLDELTYNRAQRRLLLVRHRQPEPDETEAEAAVAPAEEREPSAAAGPVVRTEEDGVLILEVTVPRIYDENVSAVRDALVEAATKKYVIIDLGRVEYISSVGLGALVSIYKLIRSRNAHLALVSVQPAVRDIIMSAHLERLFQILPDRKAGVAAMKRLGGHRG